MARRQEEDMVERLLRLQQQGVQKPAEVEELPVVSGLPTLRQARENAGLSQRALGKRIGLDGSYYSRLERGKEALSEKRVAQLRELLGDFTPPGKVLETPVILPPPEPSADVPVLRALRESKGLTQLQVANAIGMNAGYYGRIENGTRPVNPELKLKLTKALGEFRDPPRRSEYRERAARQGNALQEATIRKEAEASVALDGETQSMDILDSPLGIDEKRLAFERATYSQSGRVPTNTELAEAAKDKTLFDVFRGWLATHHYNDNSDYEEWLDWAATNLVNDPGVQAVLTRINALTAEGAEAQTVASIAEYVRERTMKLNKLAKAGDVWFVDYIGELANQIERGAWHKVQRPDVSNPELWR